MTLNKIVCILQLNLPLVWLILVLSSTNVFAVEHPQVQVEISGIDQEIKDNILAFLTLYQFRNQNGLDAERLRLLHNKAPEDIRNAIQPFGYFNPIIHSDLLSNNKGWIARYRIELGPPVKIATVDFRILGPASTDKMFEHSLPIKIGDNLNQTVYEKAKQHILNRALEAGYLNAIYVRHELAVDSKANTASIHLWINSGPQFSFGQIRFKQNILDPKFLNRYLDFQAGDLFHQEQLTKLQSRLIASEYFRQVEVQIKQDDIQDNRVPVDFVLTPNLPNRYRTGIGFSTDSGPRITLDWLRRRIGHQGQHMNTELRLSAPESTFKSEYTIPLQHPWQDALAFSLEASHIANDTRKGNSINATAAYTIGLEHGWKRILALNYGYENFEIESTHSYYQLIPSVTWTRIRQEPTGFIRPGNKLSLQILGAGQPLSSSNFLQIRASGNMIRGLTENWRLLTRVELGTSISASITDIPASKRFFAGGDNSIRGYTMEQIGPKDNTGQVIGGRLLAIGSIEFERHIVGKWSGAVFYDFGGAFDIDYEGSQAQGLGFGIRWNSPIGPVRLDLASALSFARNPWRLHIVIGPEF